MLLAPLRWLGRNLSTLLLALVLAVVVWVSAVLEQDPSVQAAYPLPVEVETVGLDSNLMVVRELPDEVRVTINAPSSRWEQLNNNPELISAWVDLSGLGPGRHTVEVRTQVAIVPAQIVRVVPEEIQIELEPLASRSFTVEPRVTGEPSFGYRRGEIEVDPQEVTISGPASQVNRVSQVRAPIDISGAVETVRRRVPVQPLDDNGNIVNEVTVTPPEVTVTQTVNLLGGYRNVVVKVVTTGQVAEGYWLTNISISPPNVIVFSTNPSLVNALPGFVETEPVDLSGLRDDADIRANLQLPEGVTLAGEQSVLVRIGIATLEGSLRISLRPEVIGLPPELSALVSPETVEVILVGPLPVLQNLMPASVRLSINLAGLEPGDYQAMPAVDLLPSEIRVESILPQTVQVTIGPAPTPTPTSSVVLTVLPSPTPSPDQTPTPTSAP